MALFRHGIAVGLDLSSALVWPTDELFNINSNINIIMEGQWTESDCDCDGKVRAIALRLTTRWLRLPR